MTTTLIGEGNTIIASKAVFNGDASWCEITNSSYPTLDVNRDRPLASRAFKIPMESAEDFVDECIPNGIPGRHPTMKSLYVDAIKFSPFSDGNVSFYQHSDGIALPGFWNCLVTYSRSNEAADPADPEPDPENPVSPADLLDCTITCTNEIMLLEGDGFKWAGDAKRIANRHQFPKIVPIIDREYNLPRVSSIPWDIIQPCVGCINNAAYMGCPAETLLYVSATIKSKISLSGVASYGISHKFKERRLSFMKPAAIPADPPTKELAGWNHFFDTKSQLWKKTDPLVYTGVSFAGILPGVT